MYCEHGRTAVTCEVCAHEDARADGRRAPAAREELYAFPKAGRLRPGSCRGTPAPPAPRKRHRTVQVSNLYRSTIFALLSVAGPSTVRVDEHEGDACMTDNNVPGHYLVYAIRANVPHRNRKLRRLDALGEGGVDLLRRVHDKIAALGGDFQDRGNEGLSIMELKPRGRTLLIRAVRGPVGAPGTTYDMDQRTHSTRSPRQPALGEMRALLIIPSNGFLGLLFVERQARQTLKDVLYEYAFKPIAEETKMTIALGSWGDAADWERDLAGKIPMRVTEVRERSGQQTSESEVEPATARITVEGVGLRGRTERLRKVITDRAEHRDKELRLLLQAAIIEDEEELEKAAMDAVSEHRKSANPSEDVAQALGAYMPVRTDDDFKHKTWAVGFGEGKRSDRTVTLERGGLPQFAYETGRQHLPDRDLLPLWKQHAEQIFSAFSVALPSNYDVGAWKRTRGKE